MSCFWSRVRRLLEMFRLLCGPIGLYPVARFMKFVVICAEDEKYDQPIELSSMHCVWTAKKSIVTQFSYHLTKNFNWISIV